MNSNPPRQTDTIPRLNVLAAALLFSTGGTAIKFSSLSGAQIACFRSGLAALLLWLVVPGWRRWYRASSLWVGGAFATTLVLFVMANTLTTAANAIFLQYSAPLYLLVLAPLILGESNRRSDLAVLAILATGVMFILIGQDAPSRTAPDPVKGDVVAACAGLTWALTLLGFRWIGRRPETPRGGGTAVVAGNLIACIVCLPWAFPLREAAAIDWGVVAYLGVIQVAAAYVLLLRGAHRLRALEVSLLLLIEPVASAVWAGIVHGEIPGKTALIGCTLILAGVLGQMLRKEPG